jgi:hypothetical protein
VRPATSTRRIDRGGSLLLALAVLLAAPGRPVHADEAPLDEYQVKTAFLYNFMKFVDWPERAFADASAPVVLAILGDDPFGATIDKLQAKTVKGRPIVIRRAATLRALGTFHLIFVPASDRSDFDAIRAAADEMGALTVGDGRGFRAKGGMIELVRDGDRIGFEVNLEAARRAGLTISSKLLSLAKVVGGNGG